MLDDAGREPEAHPGGPVSVQVPAAFRPEKADILVAGSLALDLNCDYAPEDGAGPATPQLHTSNPARIRQTVGGVGHNVALAAHRLGGGARVALCSLVGGDVAGQTVLSALGASGVSTAHVRQLPTARTAQYVAVNDANKDLVQAMADMDIFTAESASTTAAEGGWESAVVAAAQPKWLVLDANWSSAGLRRWIRAGREHGARIVFEPVSVAKAAARLFPPLASRASRSTSTPSTPARRDDDDDMYFPTSPLLDLATPNQDELAALWAAASSRDYLSHPSWFAVIDALGLPAHGARDRFERLASPALADAGVCQQAVQLLPLIPRLAVKLGPRGVLLAELLAGDDPRLRDPACAPWVLARGLPGASVGGVYMRLFPPPEKMAAGEIVSVNGAGDSFAGALVAGLARGGQADQLVDMAQRAAAMSLRTGEAVSGGLGVLHAELVRAVGQGVASP